MTLQEAFHAYMIAQAAVSGLLGTRLYPEIAPTDTPLPYCTYKVPSDVPIYHMTGAAGIANAHIAVDVWAENEPSRTRVAKTLQAALEQWVLSGSISPGIAVRFAGLETQEDSFVAPSDGSERGVYQRTLDLNIWYKSA